MTDWLNIDYRAGPGSILHEPGGISAGLLLPSTVSHHSLIPERVTARLRSTAVPARVKRFLKCFPHSVKRACIEGKPNFAAWQHSSQLDNMNTTRSDTDGWWQFCCQVYSRSQRPFAKFGAWLIEYKDMKDRRRRTQRVRRMQKSH